MIVGKPSKAAWRTVEERLGVPAHEIAMIGDDLTMDVRLGRMGGARTVLVASGITGHLELGDIPATHRPDAMVGGGRRAARPDLAAAGR